MKNGHIFVSYTLVLLVLILLNGLTPKIVLAQDTEGQQNTAEGIVDPSAPIVFSWRPWKNVSSYRLQLAKDPSFTNIVFDVQVSGTTYQYNGTLEAGSNYFWRTKAVGIPSDWSATFSFQTEGTAQPAASLSSDYVTKLLEPKNGSIDCPVHSLNFSWEPFKKATKYNFILAKDAMLTQVVVDIEVPATSYQYNGTLHYSTIYYWRVQALEVHGQIIPSDWSATYVFQTVSMQNGVLSAPHQSTGSNRSSSTGMSCDMASSNQKSTASDLSAALIGPLLVGLAIMRKRKCSK